MPSYVRGDAMNYPQQVPEGWTKGEPVKTFGDGRRHVVFRDLPPGEMRADEALLTFDSHAGCVAWLKWWNS